MNVKKFAIGIIILGLVIAAYGVFAYMKAGQVETSNSKYTAHFDNWMYSRAAKARQEAQLPAIVLGGIIFVIGGIIYFAAKDKQPAK